jgi:hypothetical protein
MVSFPPSFYLKMARTGKIHIVFYAATAVVYLNESRGGMPGRNPRRTGVFCGKAERNQLRRWEGHKPPGL